MMKTGDSCVSCSDRASWDWKEINMQISGVNNTNLSPASINNNNNNNNNSNPKRYSNIKPPVPPKPTVIPKPIVTPKPKNFCVSPKVNLTNTNNSVKKENTHILNNHKVICRSSKIISGNTNENNSELNSSKYITNVPSPNKPESISEHSNNEIGNNLITQNKQEAPVHDITIRSDLDVRYDDTDSNESLITDSSLNVDNSHFDTDNHDYSDDVSSSLMENALENCIQEDISKPLSESSSSISDSDCDYLSALPPKESDGSSQCSSNDPSGPVSDWPLTDTLAGFDDESKVLNSEQHNNRFKKAFMVAKEIMTSEASFVAVLKLLNEDFRIFLNSKGCVSCHNQSTTANEREKKTEAVPERELDEILKYLPNLQNLNEEILTDFRIRIADWETYPKIADIIVRKGPFLKLYATYIKELENHTNLLQECVTRYPFFGECLQEFESSELSRHIPLNKHMLTPMQRITKYKELMKQYIKYLDEDSIDYVDAANALQIVKDVAEHANEAIRELENSARLLSLQERLNGISNADPSSAPSTSNLVHLLVEPGRTLVKEGQLMKLCRRGVRVVYLILLSDSLLYTIQEPHGGKNCPLKLRYKLPLEGMRADIPISEDFQNEFSVISTSRSFTVRASSARERDEWIRSIRGAIETNANRRNSFMLAKTAEFEILSANVLGKQAPAWIPDNRVTMCQVCTSEFTITFRRHHCRACGKVVCRHCSSNRAPLAYLEYQTERVCDNCFEELERAVTVMEGKDDSGDEESKANGKRKLKDLKARFKKGIRDNRRHRSRKPERLLEVCGGDLESEICGYLRHFSRRTWRHGWFVLKDKVLYEYRAPEDVCALSSLPVLGYSVNSEFESLDIFYGMNYSNAFQLVHLNQPPLIYYAESLELAQKWRKAMEKSVVL